jgi:hypothetical protein
MSLDDFRAFYEAHFHFAWRVLRRLGAGDDELPDLQLLRGLPEEQRVVFLLFELEGLSGDEIAETLSIPVGTVRSRLRLARENFRSALEHSTRRLEEAGYRNV